MSLKQQKQKSLAFRKKKYNLKLGWLVLQLTSHISIELDGPEQAIGIANENLKSRHRCYFVQPFFFIKI